MSSTCRYCHCDDFAHYLGCRETMTSEEWNNSIAKAEAAAKAGTL